MSILHLLASDNFITVNRTLIKMIGLEAAVLLGEFASEASYWMDKEGTENGFFYSTIENVEDRTSLSVYQQKQAINILTENGFIEVKRMGMPAKRYIKVNEDELEKVLTNKIASFSQTRLLKTNEQDCEFFATNKTKENKTKQRDKREERKNTFDSILDSEEIIRENPALRESFVEFIKMRKLIKKPLTDKALKLNINQASKLAGGDPILMQAIVEQSIQHSWQTMYPLKDNQGSQKAAGTASDDWWDRMLEEAKRQDKEEADAKANDGSGNEGFVGYLPNEIP